MGVQARGFICTCLILRGVVSSGGATSNLLFCFFTSKPKQVLGSTICDVDLFVVLACFLSAFWPLASSFSQSRKSNHVCQKRWWRHDLGIHSISLLYCLGLGGVVGLDRFDRYIASAYIYKFCKDSGVVMTILKEATSCTICQFCDAARWFFRNFGSGCPMYMRWVSWCPWNASSWGGRITK